MSSTEVLIDTQWNVNELMKDFNKISDSFNRYIVECKCSNSNVKYAANRVLIDTQWNVNIDCDGIPHKIGLVLIDTQWNVNKLSDISCNRKKYGFNRYIVECKYTRAEYKTLWQNSFNRYIVECK